MNIIEKIDNILFNLNDNNNVNDTKKILNSIINYLEKQDKLNTDSKDVLKIAKNMLKQIKDGDEISTKQVDWVHKISKILFN